MVTLARRAPEGSGAGRRDAPSLYYVLSGEQFPLPYLLECGEACERAGFDGVWMSDHFQPWQPNEGHAGSAWVTLAALTQRTSRVMLGTGVTCPTFRYRPAVVAQTWAALSILAPGRVFLGLGSGENLNEGAAGGGWATYNERADRLVEAIEIIRALWMGLDTRIKGKFWDVDGRLYDPPASPIPLYIAAGGPKSARIAGLHGDGLITSADALRRDKGSLRTAWEQGAREAGKDPTVGAIVVEHWAFIGDERDAQEGARRWRFGPRAWEPGYIDNVSPVDIQARAEREIPLQQVLEQWTVSADPGVHAESIEQLVDRGATHVVIHFAGQDQKKAIELFASEVLPRLVRSASG
jgi:TAT-translocated FGD2 family F420-dependent dehydrogenase